MHLHSQARGTLRLRRALRRVRAGPRAGRRTSRSGRRPARSTRADPQWTIPSPDGTWDTHFVDLQRDATVADVLRATGAGMRSAEHVKRYTTIGTAHDQGKTAGVDTLGVIAEALGASPRAPRRSARRTRRCRSRCSPAATAATCTTRPASRRSTRGTSRAAREFEDVGQWKRPWYYPQRRRGHDRRRAARVPGRPRPASRMMDASTLGKIEIVGPDAPRVPEPHVHQRVREARRSAPPATG